MATILEILKKSVEDRRKDYKAVGIERVVIDGNVFTDYGAFSFIREKSYIESPERSGDGTVGNLNSYATFTTPHLKIDFSLMSIDSYRTLMNLIYEKNEFVVECYDVVRNVKVQERMYFATEEMPKLWTIARALNGEEWVELLGVQDYTVEMIGTNNTFEKIDILYYDENGKLIEGGYQEAEIGIETIIRFDYIPLSGKRFDGEWTSKPNGEGQLYRNGDVITINGYELNESTGGYEFKLYAKTVDTNEYTLSFNYGIGIAPVKSVGGEPVLNVPIKNGQFIGQAIDNANIQTTNGVFYFPSNGTGLKEIEYELGGEKFKVSGETAYRFMGWFWTSEYNDDTRVLATHYYKYNLNRTIYQIYEPIQYMVLYMTGTGEISLPPQGVGYGKPIPLPTLARNGYTFKGWELSNGKEAPTTMPPVSITLYAKWEKSE
jgi:uncharacterized repeat protein (TIGR02543 family)